MSDNFRSLAQSRLPRTKGQRTAARIMDTAEALFAQQGYPGTSLRQIARGAGIQEPGLYNHFAGKLEIYEAVMNRALAPITAALSLRLKQATGLPDFTELPSLITDLLIERPHRAALLLQVLNSAEDTAITRQYRNWLETIFDSGVEGLGLLGLGVGLDRQALILNLIGILNITAGYVLSREQIKLMGGGEIIDPDNIARQKALLRKVIRAMLIN